MPSLRTVRVALLSAALVRVVPAAGLDAAPTDPVSPSDAEPADESSAPLAQLETPELSEYERGRRYQAIGRFDEAAQEYEHYLAHCDESGVYTVDALSQLTILLLGLGDPDRAVAVLDRSALLVSPQAPWLLARLDAAVVDWYAEHQAWQTLVAFLTTARLARIDGAPPDVRAPVHAALGRAHAALGQSDAAQAQYEKVVAIWAGPEQAWREIKASAQAEKLSPGAAERRGGRALTAVGEALFCLAEFKRQHTPMTPMPRYPRHSKYVQEYYDQVSHVFLGRDLRQRRLEADYRKIVDLWPVAPPQWVIAAASRVGDLWAEAVEQIATAAPTDAFLDSKLAAANKDAIRDAIAPWLARARSVFETCLGYSVKYQYSDAWSRHCEGWLVHQFPEEYPPTADFLFVPKWRAPDRFQGWVPVDRQDRRRRELPRTPTR